MRNGLIRATAFALVHLVLFATTFILSAGNAMQRMDSGGEADGLERATQVVFFIMSLPLLPLLQAVGVPFPGLLGYVPILANSMLWGMTCALALRLAAPARLAPKH